MIDMDQRRMDRTLAGAVFLIAFGVYLKTMAPTVSFWDCGEFIACAYTLGVPHPPGSPLFVLIGRLFALFPVSADVAFRVNLVSAVTSAVAVGLVYLITVRLIGLWQGSGDRLAACVGGVVAALSLAFSNSFWFNATEAEVYGFSMLFTALALYLALVWAETHEAPESDRLLLFIAYLFGLGGGVHLLCLLTLPTILLIILYTDPKRLGRPGLWGGALLLFLLGYSTYLSLFIRSGMQPAIDQNDPETLSHFWNFLMRKQYGEESMLLGIFQRKAAFWDYQIWNMGVKYLFQQFAMPFLNVASAAFRKATGPELDPVIFSPLPYALGAWGMIVHLQKDQKRFVAMLAMFGIMGLGLIVYLNMQDPQPRERDYVFVGAFATFAVWMGMGTADLVRAVGKGDRVRTVAAAALLLIPVGAAASGFRKHDRTGDTIAHDYAYNILQTCDRDAVLFTNGDNDTFPLWYLQEVEGVRRDVRVVNLSLLNTSWYIRQLRDFSPRLPVPLSDAEIEEVCANTVEAVEKTGRYWPETKAVTAGGITWKIPKNPYLYLRTQDVMVWKLVDWVDRKRPVYFAITVPDENTVGLTPFLVVEGMALKVGDREGAQIDTDRAWRNLREVYRLRGVNDPKVYKEPDTASLLSNYQALYLQVAEAYARRGDPEKVREVLRRCEAEGMQPDDWRAFLLMGRVAALAGQRAEALRLLEKSRGLSHPGNPFQRLPLADAMAEAGALDQAVALYREVLAHARAGDGMSPGEGQRVFETATFNLAVALDRKGETQEAIVTLEGLARTNPDDPNVQQALRILREKRK
ncbi:MAG: DUF2723 domain-containing protein [Candidatus Latescibacteria bacterium]|nr:DUF2723 domain-containing protein [Candidatus Latescibacterota bacterium]